MGNKITWSSVIGFILLLSAIVVYVLFYVASDPRSVLGLVNLARVAGSYREFCEMVSFHAVCKSSLFYVWVVSKLSVEYISVLQVVVSILVYIAVYRVYRSHIVSGLSAFTYILAPTTLSAHSLDQTGLFLTMQFIALGSLLVLIGFLKDMDLKYIIPSVIIYVFMLFHVLIPIMLVVISLMLLVSFIHGVVNKRLEITLGVLLTLFLIVYIYNGVRYYSIISVPAIVLSIGVLILYRVDLRWRMGLAYRSSLTMILIFIALITGITMYLLGVKPVITPTGSNPIVLYGLPGLLAVPGAVFALIASRNIYEKYLLAFTSAILIVSIFEVYAIIIAILFLTMLSAVFYHNVVEYCRVFIESKERALWKGLVIVPLVLFIATPIYASVLIYNKQYPGINPFNEMSSLVRERGLEDTKLDFKILSGEIAGALEKTAASRNILLITNWEYSDYILGVLASSGFKPRVIAHSISDIEDRSLLSRIMTSNWRVASQVLRNISNEIGVEDTYIIITFAYSSQQNYSFIGVPREFYIPGEDYPTVIFEGYGEIFYNLRYLAYANRSISEYINILPIENLRSTSLSWTSSGRELLVTQLCIKALEEYGYISVYNYMTERPRLTSVIEGFDLVYVKNIELGKVSLTYYGTFDISYMIALFKLNYQRGG